MGEFAVRCILILGASRAPQVVLGTFGRLKLEVLGIVRVITETLNPHYLQGKVAVSLRAGDGNRTRVLSLGTHAHLYIESLNLS